jgi:tetratricopeptide (TPR) repeat protein
VEVAPGTKFCSDCGTAIAGLPAAPLEKASVVPMATDGQSVAVGLYRSIQGIYSGYLLERFDAAMRERNVVRRMDLLDPGAIEHDVDHALYEMTAAVSKVLNHRGAGNVPIDTTALYNECKALLGPVNATLSTLRGIMAEAGIAVQTKGSAGMVTGAILGTRSKSMWGNLAVTGLGAAYDSAGHNRRVQAVASRYNSSAAQLGKDFQSTWERIFDKVVVAAGAALRLQLPGTKQVQPAVSDLSDALAHAHDALASNQVELAMASASRAVSICSDDPAALAVRGEARLRNGEPDAALEDAQKVLMREPMYAEALLLKAEALHAKKSSDANPDTDTQVRQLAQNILSGDADYRTLLKAASFCEGIGHADLSQALRNKAAASVPFIYPERAGRINQMVGRICSGGTAKGGRNLLNMGGLLKIAVKAGSAMTEGERQKVMQYFGGLYDSEVVLCSAFGPSGFCVITNHRLLHYGTLAKPHEYQLPLCEISHFAIAGILYSHIKICTRKGEKVERMIGNQGNTELRVFERAITEVVLPALERWIELSEIPPLATTQPSVGLPHLPNRKVVPPPLPKT